MFAGGVGIGVVMVCVAKGGSLQYIRFLFVLIRTKKIAKIAIIERPRRIVAVRRKLINFEALII